MFNLEIRHDGVVIFDREVSGKEEAKHLVDVFTRDSTITSDKTKFVYVEYDEDYQEVETEEL